MASYVRSVSFIADIEETFETQKGICYDYAALFAAMLRSQGIPTKLMKGFTDNVDEYHAWNEVWLSDEERWMVVDTTFDAVSHAAGRRTRMEKDAALYRADKEF